MGYRALPRGNETGGDLMADEGLGQVEVTGWWVGYYRYSFDDLAVFPIIARISQSGDRVTGEMYDYYPNGSDYLKRFLEGNYETITQGTIRSLERVIKRFGTETFVVAAELTDTSDLEGRFTGSLVEFTKAYRGSIDLNWIVKGKKVAALQRRRDRVYYSGQLDRESMCIRGEWLIRIRGQLGRFLPPLSRGNFELHRKSQDRDTKRHVSISKTQRSRTFHVKP